MYIWIYGYMDIWICMYVSADPVPATPRHILTNDAKFKFIIISPRRYLYKWRHAHKLHHAFCCCWLCKHAKLALQQLLMHSLGLKMFQDVFAKGYVLVVTSSEDVRRHPKQARVHRA